ncbi:unnamed protein product, partial [Schistosoma mattheei]
VNFIVITLVNSVKSTPSSEVKSASSFSTFNSINCARPTLSLSLLKVIFPRCNTADTTRRHKSISSCGSPNVCQLSSNIDKPSGSECVLNARLESFIKY